jgi:FKBP12-rapamycin complex-associated protein
MDSDLQPFLFPEVSLQTDKAYISINLSTEPVIVTKLVLSLRTLGSFADNGRLALPGVYEALLPFVQDVVTKYLAHPTVEVRREAALCCCRLLLPPIRADSTVEDERNNIEEIPFRSFKTSDGVKGWFRASHVQSTSASVVEEVLKTLTTSVVSDPSPILRLCIVQSLDARYDPYLCMPHHLLPLFLLLRDEKFFIRVAALQLLGRLSLHNPAPILPPMRRLLLELLTELRSGGDAVGSRETAIRLLIVFLTSDALHRLVHPYISTIISSLPLRGVAPRLASVSLEALGKLAEVEQSNMLPWVDTLFPSILDSVQDYSSATQQATSFRALGQIAGSTGYVITPYLRYPQLLPLASAVLPGTRRAPWALRREVMRTLGILGAIDPQRYTSVISKSRKRGGWGGGYFVEDEAEMNSSVGSSSIPDACAENRALKPSKKSEQTHRTSGGTEKSFLDATDDDDDEPAHFCMYEQYSCMAQPTSKLSPPQRLCPMNDDFYSTVVIQALTRILKDQSLAVHHGMAMQAIMFTFNSLGLKCVKYLPRVLPHLVHTVRTCNQSALREGLMQQIAKLCNIVKDHLRPYVDSIFSLVEDFWNSRHLPTILQLVEQMSEAVPDYFTNYIPRLISLLLTSLDAPRISEWTLASGQNINANLSSVSDAKRLELVLHSIRSLKSILSEYLHLLIPSLVKLVETISSTNSTLAERDVKYTGEGDVLKTKVVVLALETLASVIAGGDNSSTVMAFFLANASASLSQTDVSQQITARAAQPLIRILGREPHPNRIVGIAIVETLCVCAVRLGREKWCLFYHSSARAAIQSWQTWVNYYSLQDAPASKDIEDKLQWTGGLSTYDKLIHDIINKNDCVGSKEYMNINELDQQLDRLNHLDDMYDDEGKSLDAGTTVFGNIHGSIPQIQTVNQASAFRVNQAHLQRAWDVSQRTTREDWDEWIRRFSVQLLREAPNPALRAAAGLAHAFPSLGTELFCAAFLCCWSNLSDEYQKNLIRSLEVAFVSSDVSPEILQSLLNLCEVSFHVIFFMFWSSSIIAFFDWSAFLPSSWEDTL